MTQPDEPTTNAREPIFKLPAVVMGLAIFLFLIELAAVVVLGDTGKSTLVFWFGFIPWRFIHAETIGEWLPFTLTTISHAFLHGGWEHLLINIAWLVIFGTPVARRYGPSGFLAIFVLSSIAGALAFSLNGASEFKVLVGASGGIAGLTGAAVRFMFQPMQYAVHPETGERIMLGQKLATFAQLMIDRRARFFIIIWVGLNGIAPLLPLFFEDMQVQIAWEAHLGGFFAGLLLVQLVETVQVKMALRGRS